MRFGVYLPTVKEFADAGLLAELAREAEQRGWDGVFIWDVIALSLDDDPWPNVDPWVALATIAGATARVRIGPIVEAVARRRPWRLARETVSVDRLSRGRLVLAVGLGADARSEFEAFGEDGDESLRAEKLDEGLELLTKFWKGKRVKHRAITSEWISGRSSRRRARPRASRSGSAVRGRTRRRCAARCAGTASCPYIPSGPTGC